MEREPGPGKAEAGQTIADIADLICRGGWPRMVGMAPAVAQARLRDYLDDIARVDISRVAGVRRDPALAGRLLASLARNEATAASHATLRADLTEQDAGPPARSTLRAYLDELARLFVIEPLPAWSVHLRSPARLRRTPKRYFVDPALAVAELSASAAWLRSDLARRAGPSHRDHRFRTRLPDRRRHSGRAPRRPQALTQVTAASATSRRPGAGHG